MGTPTIQSMRYLGDHLKPYKVPVTASESGTVIETTVLSDGSEVFAVLIEADGQHIRLHASDLNHACDMQLAVEAAHAITD